MKIFFHKTHIQIISPRLTYLSGLLNGHAGETRAFAAFPFIVFRSEEEIVPWIINHELIHFKQQVELLFVGSLLLTILETLYGFLFLGKSWKSIYLWRAMEQEAYLNHHNQEYLKTRKPFSTFRYIRNKKKIEFTDIPGEVLVSS